MARKIHFGTRITGIKQVILLLAIVVFVPSAIQAQDEMSRTHLVSVTGKFVDDFVFRVQIHNKSNSPITVFRNRTRPPFLRFFVVDRAGDQVEAASWIGDVNDEDIIIPALADRHFDTRLGDWIADLDKLAGSRCLDFLWVWNLSIESFKHPFFFGGAMPLNCDYENLETAN